jgi:hypothetical protein
VYIISVEVLKGIGLSENLDVGGSIIHLREVGREIFDSMQLGHDRI